MGDLVKDPLKSISFVLKMIWDWWLGGSWWGLGWGEGGSWWGWGWMRVGHGGVGCSGGVE